jgi:hypothetical protein
VARSNKTNKCQQRKQNKNQQKIRTSLANNSMSIGPRVVYKITRAVGFGRMEALMAAEGRRERKEKLQKTNKQTTNNQFATIPATII